MTTKEILLTITDELTDCLADLKEEQLSELELLIRKADKIFVAGAGRSLMMIRGLAMRLMHMGYKAYVVGETTTPALEPGDLLIIASGSGNTETLTAIADKCKRLGGVLALITTMPDSKRLTVSSIFPPPPPKTAKTKGVPSSPAPTPLSSPYCFWEMP